ncbi:MAG: hypothetical protein ACD_18C00149G0003 [uncultured bacterium]|nr:MAG: hypothetical protein ACD_18C00149G0003 [uncultured bacterium]OGH84735.1 MAG: hypothetical protein A2488_03080 [Candidatus Magasanikbacteria bacterium RIFOXYC12_FULL_32_21b]OGH88891.1 MAG: hypothetical protein A2507_03320 [Candidatus Magasanikbacteria bacterium RIFOXYD12_FULL_33_17]HAO52557.1 hypothetical protein [Candidatus Magasanikbacteria bacterium]
MEELQNKMPVLNRKLGNEKPKNNSGRNFLISLLFVFMLFGFFGTYYFYNKYDQIKKDPNIVSQKEVDNTLDSVKKLMLLPSEETPSMATVLDKSKLTGQAFFDNVENGDKLLIFPKAMQAIIYRPDTNKIIKVGPIFLNEDGETVEDSTTKPEEVVVVPQPENIKIAYYNGTSIVNLSAQTESMVKVAYPTYQTAVVTNATKNDYKENIIIDLSGKYSNEVTEISKLINAKVQTLPDGEIKPDADILIILGK